VKQAAAPSRRERGGRDGQWLDVQDLSSCSPEDSAGEGRVNELARREDGGVCRVTRCARAISGGRTQPVATSDLRRVCTHKITAKAALY
jgi:hypothetical protein